MTLKDVRLRQPLASVKLAENGNDTLVIPCNFVNTLKAFFRCEGIECHVVKTPALYPKDKLDTELKRYQDYSLGFYRQKPAVIISKFDAEDLFKWSLQICGLNKDPSYENYLDDRSVKAAEYYQENYGDE